MEAEMVGCDEGREYMFGSQGREMFTANISILEMATADPDIMVIMYLAATGLMML